MPLRQLQIIAREENAGPLRAIIEQADPPCVWSNPIGDGLTLTSVTLQMEHVEALSDAVLGTLGHDDALRITIFEIAAMYPTLPEPEPEPEPDQAKQGEPDPEERRWTPRFGRVSREELTEDIDSAARSSPVTLIMVVLATLVACVGLVKDSPAIVIGAMVIAPLLGPNIALALGTTLGDLKMVRRAIASNLKGLTLALAVSIAFGLLVARDGATDEMAAWSVVDLGDILLALASGAAGAIAFTSGASQVVVGVMVAVALLPPTSVLGMLVGDRSWNESGSAALLVATNVVCINLSATAVFRLQGVSPGRWWERERAKGASVRAIVMWAAALGVLAALIVLTDPT